MSTTISNVASTMTQPTTQSVQSKSASSSEKATSKKTEKSGEQAAAVYEKSSEQGAEKKATYTINKMSEKDRSALVEQLKADQEQRQSQLMDIVKQMMNGQGKAYSIASGDDSIWKFLASGDFEVDPATKAQAQEDISENGYWGVNQTSQRLFDFASALAGDDVEKMQKMQQAIQTGFDQATGAWGKNLPDISKQTLDATNKMFEDYYASKSES